MQASPLNWNLIFILVLFFLGIICGVGVYLTARRFARKKSIEPTCGKCGYIVRGITTLHCPECGSDLREVGIVKPKPAPVMAPLAAIAAACAVFLLVLVFLGMSVHLVPVPQSHTPVLAKPSLPTTQPAPALQP